MKNQLIINVPFFPLNYLFKIIDLISQNSRLEEKLLGLRYNRFFKNVESYQNTYSLLIKDEFLKHKKNYHS